VLEIETRLSTTRPSAQTVCRAPSSVILSEFSAVTEEVAHLIKRLPPKTSPLDCLPVALLKATVHVMAPLLAQLANLSFAAGAFPSRYKLGHVIPLLKSRACPGMTLQFTGPSFAYSQLIALDTRRSLFFIVTFIKIL